ncbi:MAG: pyridoxamine 5'-phosphate oxidase family protein [Deltaproteobacteria bacterium]|nr:pyridoxamine 5'-phosphate oxidase family protein [Deltaproteobacteria bacterium]
MQEVLDFLKANRTVFLATSDHGQARVRPFQFQFAVDGRLWFCTAKSKEVYAQLIQDPRFELSAMAPDWATLRLKGEVNLDDDPAIKARILEENEMIRGIYGSADNPDFTAFSVDHGTAFLFDFSGEPPKSFTF